MLCRVKHRLVKTTICDEGAKKGLKIFWSFNIDFCKNRNLGVFQIRKGLHWGYIKKLPISQSLFGVFTSNMKPLLTLHLYCFLAVMKGAAGHGRLWEPPARSTLFRRGYATTPNYNDNQLFCGGFAVIVSFISDFVTLTFSSKARSYNRMNPLNLPCWLDAFIYILIHLFEVEVRVVSLSFCVFLVGISFVLSFIFRGKEPLSIWLFFKEKKWRRKF